MLFRSIVIAVAVMIRSAWSAWKAPGRETERREIVLSIDAKRTKGSPSVLRTQSLTSIESSRRPFSTRGAISQVEIVEMTMLFSDFALFVAVSARSGSLSGSLIHQSHT